MREPKVNVEDPQVRAAVLDLFRASQAFKDAYTDYRRTGDEQALVDAVGRVDEARVRVLDAQSR